MNNTQLSDQSPQRELQHLRSQYQNKSKDRQSIAKNKVGENIMAQSFVTKRPTLSENMLLSPLSFGGGGDECIDYNYDQGNGKFLNFPETTKYSKLKT